MALKLGELVAYLKADDEQFKKGLAGVKKHWERMGGTLKAGAAVIGAAAGAALAAGAVSAMDMQKANAKLSAQLGLSAQESERIGAVAGELYADAFGGSVEEVNTAVAAVVSSIDGMRDASSEAVKDLTGDVLNLATAFEIDVSRAAQVAGQLVKAGIATDAAQALDLLTVSLQRVPAAVREDILDALDEYGPFMQSIGVTGEKAFSLLVAAAEKGMYGIDKTGDALKEFTIRATDMSGTTKEAYDALGMSQEDMTRRLLAGGETARQAFDQIIAGLLGIKDPVAQSQAALALFGTPLEDLSVSEIPDFLASLQGAVGGLGEVEGAADRMGDTLRDNAATKLESFKRKAQQALVEKLAEALPTIEKVVDWLGRHSDVIGPLVTVLGALAVIIGTIIGVYKLWTIAQLALNLVMMANPIVLIILAIMALIGVIILLWNNSEAFRNFFIGLWEKIKDAAGAVGRWFKETLWEKWIKGAWDGILSAGEKVWNWLKDLPGKLKTAFGKVTDFISSPFKSAFNAVASLWNRSVGKLKFSVPSWVPGIGGKSFSLPQLPKLAKGGHILGSGMAIVGEAGPELVHLGRGATVQPLAGGGGGLGGLTELLLRGEFRLRGDDLLVVIRKRVAIRGGNVQNVLGTSM